MQQNRAGRLRHLKGGQIWTPITPYTESKLHAETHLLTVYEELLKLARYQRDMLRAAGK
jgi:hypothetical protein